MVFVTLHASCAYLRGAVTGVASILLVITLKVAVKTAGLIVKRPGNQVGFKTQITRGTITTVLASWRAFLALVITISEESITARSVITSVHNACCLIRQSISVKALSAFVSLCAHRTLSHTTRFTGGTSLIPEGAFLAFCYGVTALVA